MSNLLAVLCCFVPLAPAVEPAFERPTDVRRGLPASVQELSVRLANPKRLGGVVATQLATRPDRALQTIARNLPGWSSDGGVLQAKLGGRQWQSVALFRASLQEIEKAERKQGTIRKDTGWSAGRRRFQLLASGATVRFEQRRAGTGAACAQKTTYSWRCWHKYGKGGDWRLPIVGEDGVAGYLVYSVYKSNYKNPAVGQRTAIAKWKRCAESR